MNQFESIQRQLAEIQEQLDQCATKEDIKEFKDMNKPCIINLNEDFAFMEELMKKNQQRIKSLVVNADTGEIIQVNDNGHITGVGLESDPVKSSAASLNVSLGNKEDLVAICKHENSKLELNKDMIGKLEAKTIKAGCIPTTHVQPGIPFKAASLDITLDDKIRVVGEAVRQGEITLNQARELLKLPAVKDGDLYAAPLDGVVSAEPNKVLADIILKQGEQILKQIQEQEFKTVEQRKYDAIVTNVEKELHWSNHTLYEVIDVPKLVNIYFERANDINEEDPYKYAECECLAFIKKLKK